MPLWLPDSEHDPEVEMGKALDHLGKAVEFRRQLKEIDERLDLLWAGSGATSVPEPERWYIIRRGESGIGGLWMVAEPDGSYSDPDARHLHGLMMQDGERFPHIWRRIQAGREERRKEREKAQAQRSAQFEEGLLDRLDHLENERIFVTAVHKAKVAAANEKLALAD